MTVLPRAERLKELLLLVTADCNLRCSYCYQDRRQARAMPWQVVEASLEVLLASTSPRMMVSMSGGEPLLEFDTIRRAVEFVETRRAPGQLIEYHLVTNGLLLGPEQLSFLAAHDFLLDISFDGAPAAQDARAPGTFAHLDRLLDTVRGTDDRDYYRRRVRVSVTVTRGTIPHLGDSIEYLLGKRVPEIVIQQAMGQPAWAAEDLERLDRQFARIFDRSLGHYRATGEVPFAPFRKQAGGTPPPHHGTWGCSAPLGGALAVDVDGQVYPCALLARSYRTFQGGLDERTRLLALGDVRDPALPDRLATLEEPSRRSGLFDPKRLQHAPDRPCSECRFIEDCFVCPLARADRAPAGAINRVPEDSCAFNRVLLKHRERFPVQPTRLEEIRALVERFRPGTGTPGIGDQD